MRAVGFSLLLLMAVADSGAAATDYWAFGDSVTRGEGAGIPLDVVSGHDCHTDPYPVSKCGYHWRLEDALGGIANEVINRGKAAESTAMGITRVDNLGEPLNTSRCTDPDAGDVLLLMEGTNDVSATMPSISTNTIKTNLGAILDLATTKCVHSAVASTIRRLLAGTADDSKTGDPTHAKTSDLATKISDLATEKNREYVDVWGSLCPNQPCYNVNYHGRFGPGDPGHVDEDGYEVMSPLFEAAITASPAAGAATLTSPVGDELDNTPDFEWAEHSDADWYFLEVDSGSTYGRWHPEEDICSGGTCTFNTMVALAEGDHSWRVRTRNLRGVGDWSASTEFTVYTAVPPATTPDYPSGDIFDPQPTHEWAEVIGAKEYVLEVDGMVEGTFLGSAVCVSGTCSEMPPAPGIGAHSWRVMTKNPVGDGPWSAPNDFEVLACSPMTNNLVGATVNTTLTENACDEVIVGEMGNYTVQGPSGDVTFHAGNQITFHNGFTVETDAQFTARVDK